MILSVMPSFTRITMFKSTPSPSSSASGCIWRLFLCLPSSFPPPGPLSIGKNAQPCQYHFCILSLLGLLHFRVFLYFCMFVILCFWTFVFLHIYNTKNNKVLWSSEKKRQGLSVMVNGTRQALWPKTFLSCLFLFVSIVVMSIIHEQSIFWLSDHESLYTLTHSNYKCC